MEALKNQIAVNSALREYEANMNHLRQIGTGIGETIYSEFLQAGKGAQTFAQAAKKSLASIIEQLAKKSIIDPLIGGLSKQFAATFAGTGIFPDAKGNGGLTGFMNSADPMKGITDKLHKRCVRLGNHDGRDCGKNGCGTHDCGG